MRRVVTRQERRGVTRSILVPTARGPSLFLLDRQDPKTSSNRQHCAQTKLQLYTKRSARRLVMVNEMRSRDTKISSV